jgi:hypothetical protein
MTQPAKRFVSLGETIPFVFAVFDFLAGRNEMAQWSRSSPSGASDRGLESLPVLVEGERPQVSFETPAARAPRRSARDKSLLIDVSASANALEAA